MSIDKRALPIPEVVRSKEESDQVVELIRVWWDEGAPRMVIRPALQKPATVGAILADRAWHFSQAYAEKNGTSQAQAMETIRDAWTEAHERVAARQEG